MSLLYPDGRSARCFAIFDDSAVGDARRSVMRLADERGLPPAVRDRLAIVTTELAANLARHASRGGELHCHLLMSRAGVEGVELIAVDRGPGMADVAEARRPGFSTTGGAGLGLGAIEHLSDELWIDSELERGTVVVARTFAGPRPAAGAAVGGLCVPHPHETLCGDGWTVLAEDDALTIVLADGLGHGPGAAKASRAVAEALESARPATPSACIRALGEPLKATRGAAVTACRIDLVAREASASGVGNVWGFIVAGDGSARHLVSVGGIVGRASPSAREETYPLAARSLVVLCSDGIHQRWSARDEAQRLLRRHPALAAGMICRDYSRESDDASVLAVRLGA